MLRPEAGAGGAAQDAAKPRGATGAGAGRRAASWWRLALLVVVVAAALLGYGLVAFRLGIFDLQHNKDPDRDGAPLPPAWLEPVQRLEQSLARVADQLAEAGSERRESEMALRAALGSEVAEAAETVKGLGRLVAELGNWRVEEQHAREALRDALGDLRTRFEVSRGLETSKPVMLSSAVAALGPGPVMLRSYVERASPPAPKGGAVLKGAAETCRAKLGLGLVTRWAEARQVACEPFDELDRQARAPHGSPGSPATRIYCRTRRDGMPHQTLCDGYNVALMVDRLARHLSLPPRPRVGHDEPQTNLFVVTCRRLVPEEDYGFGMDMWLRLATEEFVPRRLRAAVAEREAVRERERAEEARHRKPAPGFRAASRAGTKQADVDRLLQKLRGLRVGGLPDGTPGAAFDERQKVVEQHTHPDAPDRQDDNEEGQDGPDFEVRTSSAASTSRKPLSLGAGGSRGAPNGADRDRPSSVAAATVAKANEVAGALRKSAWSRKQDPKRSSASSGEDARPRPAKVVPSPRDAERTKNSKGRPAGGGRENEGAETETAGEEGRPELDEVRAAAVNKAERGRKGAEGWWERERWSGARVTDDGRGGGGKNDGDQEEEEKEEGKNKNKKEVSAHESNHSVNSSSSSDDGGGDVPLPFADEVRCDYWVEHTVFMILRWNVRNPYHMHEDLLHTFLAYSVLEVPLEQVQVVIADRRGDGILYDFWQRAYSPMHRVWTLQDMLDSYRSRGYRSVCFRRLIYNVHGGVSELSRAKEWPSPCVSAPVIRGFADFHLDRYQLVRPTVPAALATPEDLAWVAGAAELFMRGHPSTELPRVLVNVTLIVRPPPLKRQIHCQAELAALLRQVPFFRVRTVDFGELSTRQQMEVATETEVLAGAHGAAMIFSLYMPSYGGLVEFRHPDRGTSNHYASVANFAGLAYTRADVGYHDERSAEWYARHIVQMGVRVVERGQQRALGAVQLAGGADLSLPERLSSSRSSGSFSASASASASQPRGGPLPELLGDATRTAGVVVDENAYDADVPVIHEEDPEPPGRGVVVDAGAREDANGTDVDDAITNGEIRPADV